MEIRTAAPQDLPAVTRLEALCFPPAEAAPKAAFRDRLAACPQTCWLLWEGDTLLAMVNGMTVQTPDLTDAMYETTALHDPDGPWLMIFGVDTHPDHRRRGYAGRSAPSRHPGRPGPGAGGGGAHLQGAAAALLCQVRVCQRGGVRLGAWRGGVVPDAAGFLRAGLPRFAWGRTGQRSFWGLPHAVGTAGNGALPGGALFL